MDDVTHPRPGDHYVTRVDDVVTIVGRHGEFLWVDHHDGRPPITHDLEVVNYWTLEVPWTK